MSKRASSRIKNSMIQSAAPKSFKSQIDFSLWLEKNYSTEKELIMRLYKVHANHMGLGYKEALDESLCWGWIDGVRKALDNDSYTQRFTPRRNKSKWSEVNIKRFQELKKEGRVQNSGLEAFKRWEEMNKK
jgi:uncharacterized protein YdeI (YjbR/CyaY-like superfamily)